MLLVYFCFSARVWSVLSFWLYRISLLYLPSPYAAFPPLALERAGRDRSQQDGHARGGGGAGGAVRGLGAPGVLGMSEFRRVSCVICESVDGTFVAAGVP